MERLAFEKGPWRLHSQYDVRSFVNASEEGEVRRNHALAIYVDATNATNAPVSKYRTDLPSRAAHPSLFGITYRRDQ